MNLTRQVVMLPTEKASKIHLVSPEDEISVNYEDKDDKLVPLKHSKLIFTDEATEFGFPPQHLYITSNEEIKEGDWCINKNRDTLHIITQIHKGERIVEESWEKVIATTDKLFIKDKSYEHIAIIPESFIKAFVESNGTIKEVLVKYEEIVSKSMDKGKFPNITKLKTNPDNTIIIK